MMMRIRRLRAGEVAAPLQSVFDGMSVRSRYLRYHTEMPRLTAAYRATLTTVDGARHVVLVAERPDPEGWIPKGLGRLTAMDEDRVDVALEVVDAAQGQGIGRGLLGELVTTARVLNYRWLVAAVLAMNTPVLDWLRREFPAATVRGEGTTTIVHLPL
jgi:GNAT superfamily N-acetyltransferase